MSQKRKFYEINCSNPVEVNQALLDFEQKFKMVKKNTVFNRKEADEKVEKSTKTLATVGDEVNQTITNEASPKEEVEENNNAMPENALMEYKESPQKDTYKKKTIKEEKRVSKGIQEGLKFWEWMQKGGLKVRESLKTEIQAKQKEKGKGQNIKFNRNRSENEHFLDDYKHIERSIELGHGKITENDIMISSWNVNGLKRLLKTGNLQRYIKERELDILCLNETKLADEEFDKALTYWIPAGYTGIFNCCKISNGYSGTAIITRFKPISVKFDLGIKKHDLEGRTITAEFEKFYLVASYWSNSRGETTGLRYRVDQWDPDFRNYVTELRKKKHVILCGDLNYWATDYDIFDQVKNTEYMLEEQKNFIGLLDSGFIDTFRSLHPNTREYSFYSMSITPGVRSTTKGWRIDFFLIDKDGMPAVRDSMINHSVTGSDHFPVELIIDPKFKKCEKIV